MNPIKYMENANELEQEIIEWRHYLHQNPEIALKEFKTSAFITAKLKEFGFEEVYSGVGVTGVVAILRGRLDESILIRADIDALPLTEKVPLPYASTVPGMMHACGHDAHAAILLGVAKTMITRVKEGLELAKGIKFVFQPAEENTVNGAGRMIVDKTQIDLLDGSPRVKNCFALHLSNSYPIGKILYKTGAISANSERFQVDIVSKGGDASNPESTIDALQIAVNVSNQIFQIRGRLMKQTVPAAISIGELKGGLGPNFVAETYKITGSVRSVNNTDKDLLMGFIKSICETHQTQFKAEVKFVSFPGQRMVFNDATLQPFTVAALARAGEVINPGAQLSGEDFYNFAEARPSSYFAIGSALPGASKDGEALYAHHSPDFQIDEGCLIQGVNAWLSILQEWQES